MRYDLGRVDHTTLAFRYSWTCTLWGLSILIGALSFDNPYVLAVLALISADYLAQGVVGLWYCYKRIRAMRGDSDA